jgi:hypothetical protein
MIDTLSYVNLDVVASVTFAVGGDGRLSATIQLPPGDQRERVILGHEPTQNLKEHLVRTAVPIYLEDPDWRRWKWAQDWAQRTAQHP